ncbi:MAG TPA: hypothetical protein VK595_06140, partial [Vicinamibacterales bacterium]|nr:hypothetical protein [Vicinamibacterales bacterium]
MAVFHSFAALRPRDYASHNRGKPAGRTRLGSPIPEEGARSDVGRDPPSVPQSESELEELFDLSLDLLCIA